MGIEEYKGRRMVLLEIINYFEEHGYAPSIREICKATSYSSTSTVAHHMNMLFEEGYLESDIPRGSEVPRAFRIGKRSYDEGLAGSNESNHKMPTSD